MALRSINNTNLYPPNNNGSASSVSSLSSKNPLGIKRNNQSITVLSPLEKISGYNFALTAVAAIASAFTLTYFVISYIERSGPEHQSVTINKTLNLSIPENPILPNLNNTFAPCEYYLPKPSYSTWNGSNEICLLTTPSLVAQESVPVAQVLKPTVNTSKPLTNTSNSLVNISSAVSSLNPLYLFFPSICPCTNNKTSSSLPLSTISPSSNPVDELLEKAVLSIINNLADSDRTFASTIEKIVRDIFRYPTHYSKWTHNTGQTAYVILLLSNLQQPLVCKQLEAFLSSKTNNDEQTPAPSTFQELYSRFINNPGKYQKEAEQANVMFQKASKNCQTELLI